MVMNDEYEGLWKEAASTFSMVEFRLFDDAISTQLRQVKWENGHEWRGSKSERWCSWSWL
jgi:hypothetical protein